MPPQPETILVPESACGIENTRAPETAPPQPSTRTLLSSRLGPLRAAFFFAALLALAANGQNVPGAGSHGGLSQPLGQPGGLNDIPNNNPLNDEKVLKALNAERQKSMVSDADKLLRLVNQLNSEIARTTPAALSEAQLRQMAEIEKLAHRVREKMSTSVRGTPSYQVPHLRMH